MGFNVGSDSHSSFSVSHDSTVKTEETKGGELFANLCLLVLYSLLGYGLYSAWNYFFFINILL
jgi:hypothetical protein